MSKRRRKKQKGFFSTAQDTTIGIARLGITTGVAAGVISKAPAGTSIGGLSTGMSTISGFVPIATTASMAGGVLGLARNLNKTQPRKKRRRM